MQEGVESLETEQFSRPLQRGWSVALISLILGMLGFLSVFFASFLYLSVLPPAFGYVILLFWLPWLLIPLSAIICGYRARKLAPGQTTYYLATAGLLLGSFAVILIGTGLLATLIQLIAYLTRPPGIMS